MTAISRADERWPELPWEKWKDTAATLHMWTQIVGKTRMALSPFENHWWHVTLYVSARGLTTGAIPLGGQAFDIEFDFLNHRLLIRTSASDERSLALRPQSVASFYSEFLKTLESLGIHVKFSGTPAEVSDPIPFSKDEQHAAYDPEYANRFWRILLNCAAIFRRFRSGFYGKCSPVHFFWGSFDMAVTRFSGRRAPDRPGADALTREAYSHEVISAGFWPGNGGFNAPAFYAYAAPEPAGLDRALIRPSAAFYSQDMKEFLLRYDDVRAVESPEENVLAFLESTYEAAATLGKWDRSALERSS